MYAQVNQHDVDFDDVDSLHTKALTITEIPPHKKDHTSIDIINSNTGNNATAEKKDLKSLLNGLSTSTKGGSTKKVGPHSLDDGCSGYSLPIFVLCLFVASYCLVTFTIVPFAFSTALISFVNWLAFSAVVALFMYCFYKAVTTPGGSVPREAPWVGETAAAHMDVKRFCATCQVYRPPRTHHCKDTDRCVLRMDHHCVWVNNTVGFHNHKYFMCFVFWAVIVIIHFYVLSGFGVYYHSVHMNEGFSIFTFIFTLMFNVVLFPVFLVASIFCFYTFYLLAANKTTLEDYQYERMASTSEYRDKKHNLNIYDVGTLENINSFLGPNPLLWFIPIPNYGGDGVSFKTNTTPSKV